MTDMTFEQTLAAAKSGDEAAFATLWRQLNHALLRYLRVLAPEVAEDIASECWLQVMRSLGTFKGDEAGFKSWLFTIARNKVTDWRRYAARRPVDPLDHTDIHDRPALDDTEEDALERMSTDDALRLLAELPPDQAEIIMLRVVVGLDVHDVARIVGKRPGAVRVASHRGLRRLYDALARSDDRESTPRSGVTP
jgi:RNA polymerase sigma-70 factor (ECF subfamily)